MNTHIRTILSGAAFLSAVALACSATSTASAAQAPFAAVDNPMIGPPPSPAFVWMSGHWNSEGGQWKWAAGHWDLPPNRSAVWVAGHWIQGTAGWVWVNGAWNVSEAPQSPEAPPQPPGQSPAEANVYQAPAQGAQAVPMPSSPAPNVAGQYAPGGQEQALYQPPTVTYYPPADYGTTYPGYYWTGDAWAWGLYPALALGLGWWGPGYGGWGHGWGHGGWGYARGHGSWHHAGFAGHAGAAHIGGHWH
jgi:hypothetical protein